jgi:hypothetical protein
MVYEHTELLVFFSPPTMETDAVSETSCFCSQKNTGRWKKSKDPEILYTGNVLNTCLTLNRRSSILHLHIWVRLDDRSSYPNRNASSLYKPSQPSGAEVKCVVMARCLLPLLSIVAAPAWSHHATRCTSRPHIPSLCAGSDNTLCQKTICHAVSTSHMKSSVVCVLQQRPSNNRSSVWCDPFSSPLYLV